MPERWKAARDADEVAVEWGDVRLQLVPANGRFCFCAGCCPEPDAVRAWLESIPAPPPALLEALERMKRRGE